MIGWGAGENTFQRENLGRSGLTQNFGKWQHSPFVLSPLQQAQEKPCRSPISSPSTSSGRTKSGTPSQNLTALSPHSAGGNAEVNR